MQGCIRSIVAIGLLAAVGCQEDAGSVAPPAAVVDLGELFDANTTGTIQGQVTWRGDLPAIAPFRVHSYLDYANAGRIRGEYAHPHQPDIDPETRGIGEVVIIIRNVKSPQSKSWAHAPVQVETDSQRLTIHQGNQPARVGFVRRGDEAAFISRDVTYHTVRARGAVFFTLPFVAADQPTRRRLDQPGIVELSEGTGMYWRRAYLFVLEHPYAVLSDRTGKFVLGQVPAGTYQLTAWMPNWHVERQERDPETAIISRVIFAPAVELAETVTVTAGTATDVSFTFASDLFAARRQVAK